MDIKSGGTDIEWTKHVSSTFGSTYFYNKQLDMSQWKTLMGMVKRYEVMQGNEKWALWLFSYSDDNLSALFVMISDCSSKISKQLIQNG